MKGPGWPLRKPRLYWLRSRVMPLPANSPTATPRLAQTPCGTLRGAIRYNHTKAMKYIAGMIVNNTV